MTAPKTQAKRLFPDTSRAKGAPDPGPVECLGRTFASEEERRDHYLARLRERLPALRKRPDFPKGNDEDILRLSDPPWYTACPNPFLEEFVEHYGRPYDPEEPYHREPFAVDVSVGKTDPLYRAHGYHTKVPHLAIVPTILHYTKPGDLVLDGFCGSGMTGVAAQWCGTAPDEYRQKLEAEWKEAGREPPKWGTRRAILGDLSPAATFIAANYNIPFDLDEFADAARKILDDTEEDVGWMYETTHHDGTTQRINYTVWSEVFRCRNCGHDLVFLTQAMDSRTKAIRRRIMCPECSAVATKEQMDLRFSTAVNTMSEGTSRLPLRVPVLINYGVRKHEKSPDEMDLKRIATISNLLLPSGFPGAALPDCQMTRVGRMRTTSTSTVRDMFLPRAAHAITTVWRRASAHRRYRTRHVLLFFVEQAIWGMSILNRYQPLQHGRPGGSQVNRQLSGVYYVGSISAEVNPWYILEGKLKRLRKALQLRWDSGRVAITTSGCAFLATPSNSIDYIFTDPPFGENKYYADLNYLVESWHRVFTNAESEAIIDRVRRKRVQDYQSLMKRCFEEYYRILKPGRWMTVVFNNSHNAVWNAIQEAMGSAHFTVADVRALDKKQMSFWQATTTAAKQDLVISAYKASAELEARFRLRAGTEAAVWDFVESHCRQLPVFAEREGRSEVMQERQDFLLYDRMVAFHVERRAAVPLSAPEFYAGLRQRYIVRDDMFFLPEQVPRYESGRARVKGLFESAVVIRDEETGIRWLRSQLKRKPQTFQELHPNFMREIGGWLKHEARLELTLLLEENFLCYDGDGPVPGPIHSWLSTTYKGLRNLPKDAAPLRSKAKGRWHVPDPTKAPEVERLRQRALLQEFRSYAADKVRRMRKVRMEAVRAGFRDCWQRRDDETIIAVGRKLPRKALEEDPKLLMWYDNALTRSAAR